MVVEVWETKCVTQRRVYSRIGISFSIQLQHRGKDDGKSSLARSLNPSAKGSCVVGGKVRGSRIDHSA